MSTRTPSSAGATAVDRTARCGPSSYPEAAASLATPTPASGAAHSDTTRTIGRDFRSSDLSTRVASSDGGDEDIPMRSHQGDTIYCFHAAAEVWISKRGLPADPPQR